MTMYVFTVLAPLGAAATIYFHSAILYGFYSRAFIKLRTEDEEIHCLKEVGVTAGARESIRRDTATLATAKDTKLNLLSDV